MPRGRRTLTDRCVIMNIIMFGVAKDDIEGIMVAASLCVDGERG